MENGCEGCMKWEEHFYWNHLDVERMHFFKVMIGDFSRRVSVPKKFINHFKEDLSTFVILKGPSGNMWHVGLKKDPDNTFLQFGWSDFIKDHHIEEYDLLVFKYSGNSRFDVLMFDQTGCEKASSYSVKNHDPMHREKRSHSVEILNPHRKKIECASSRSSDEVAQVVPASGIHNTRSRCKIRTRSDKHFSPVKNTSGVTREKLNHATFILSNEKVLTDEERRRAKELAHSIQTENPFFVSIMKPSHVCKRFFFVDGSSSPFSLPSRPASYCRIGIPFSFASVHLPTKSRMIRLETPGRRENWYVSYLFHYNKSFLCGGWRSFCLDNNLEVGDACLFELTESSKKIVVTVHISHAS